MTKCTIFIDGWQMECCGDPFKIGDIVEWLAVKSDGNWSYCMDIGDIDYDYEHHSSEWQKLSKVVGRVDKIEALFCVFVPDPNDPNGRSRIRKPGAGVRRQVMEVYRKEDDFDEYTFDAYLVHLENVDISPAKESEVNFS